MLTLAPQTRQARSQFITHQQCSVFDCTCPDTHLTGVCSACCQDLVGKNLTYISQLDGLSFELYSTSVLPRLLEQVRGASGCLAAWDCWAGVAAGVGMLVAAGEAHPSTAQLLSSTCVLLRTVSVVGTGLSPHTAACFALPCLTLSVDTHTRTVVAVHVSCRWCPARMSWRSST